MHRYVEAWLKKLPYRASVVNKKVMMNQGIAALIVRLILISSFDASYNIETKNGNTTCNHRRFQ